jgi:hypothetical protein
MNTALKETSQGKGSVQVGMQLAKAYAVSPDGMLAGQTTCL